MGDTNRPGTSLVPVREYLEFPDLPFFNEEPESPLKKRTIGRCKDIYEEYKVIDNPKDAIILYDEILLFLIGPRKSKAGFLGYREFFNDSTGQDLEKGKLASEYDNLIKLMEDILDDLDEKFNLQAGEKKKLYFQRKKEILEGKTQESEEIAVPQIPNLPAVQSGLLPQRGKIAQATNWITSLGNTWQKLEESYQGFATEFQERCLEFLTDETHMHDNYDHAQRRVREIFNEVYEKYTFPKGFHFSLSEVFFGRPQTHVTHEVYDEEKKTFLDERVKLEDFYGPNLRIELEFESIQGLPDWIRKTYSLYSGKISEKIYLEEDRRRLESNTNLVGKAFFLTQLFQVGKYRIDISKKFTDISEDDELKYLLDNIWSSNGDIGNLGTLAGNIDKVEQIWENRKELKELVRYIGFENVKDTYIKGSYEAMVRALNREAKKLHPVPNRYMYRVSESLGSKNFEVGYKEDQFIKDLNYYFTSQKSDQFSFRLPVLPHFYQFTFSPIEKSDEHGYDTVYVDIRKDRVTVKVKKGLDTVEDDTVLEEVFKIVSEALQFIEKSPKIGTKK